MPTHTHLRICTAVTCKLWSAIDSVSIQEKKRNTTEMKQKQKQKQQNIFSYTLCFYSLSFSLHLSHTLAHSQLSSCFVSVCLCVWVGWQQVGLSAGCAALIALRSFVLFFYLSAFRPPSKNATTATTTNTITHKILTPQKSWR